MGGSLYRRGAQYYPVPSGPFSKGGGSYVDRIPEVAPSTKREGGSPAKKKIIIMIILMVPT